jgi:hypothetical protein
MIGDRARRVGAGEHDGAEPFVGQRERDRLGAQERRQHDGVPTCAQSLRGAFAVGLRPGDEEPHASHRREEIGTGARLELGPGISA